MTMPRQCKGSRAQQTLSQQRKQGEKGRLNETTTRSLQRPVRRGPPPSTREKAATSLVFQKLALQPHLVFRPSRSSSSLSPASSIATQGVEYGGTWGEGARADEWEKRSSKPHWGKLFCWGSGDICVLLGELAGILELVWGVAKICMHTRSRQRQAVKGGGVQQSRHICRLERRSGGYAS